jgi:hypothetical protein
MTFRITRQRSDASSADAGSQQPKPWPVRTMTWIVLAVVSGLIGWLVAELLK